MLMILSFSQGRDGTKPILLIACIPSPLPLAKYEQDSLAHSPKVQALTVLTLLKLAILLCLTL